MILIVFFVHDIIDSDIVILYSSTADTNRMEYTDDLYLDPLSQNVIWMKSDGTHEITPIQNIQFIVKCHPWERRDHPLNDLTIFILLCRMIKLTTPVFEDIFYSNLAVDNSRILQCALRICSKRGVIFLFCCCL